MSGAGRQSRLAAAVDFVRSVPQPFRATLTGPSAVKKFFHRQSDAISFAQEFQGELLVFAFESSALGSEGQRQFLACSAEGFFYEYEQLQEKFRHYYEVITEGSPCKLYCDLEFSPPDNPGLDGEALTARFIELLRRCFELFFDKQLATDDVVVLDASCAEKFSKHVIFPSAIFANNHDMGVFLRAVHRALQLLARSEAAQPSCPSCAAAASNLKDNLQPPPQQPENFFVRPKASEEEEPPAFFLDLAVYSRNRNFRIFLSSKLSATRPLLPDLKWPPPAPLAPLAFFLRTLVTFGTRGTRPLRLPWTCSCGTAFQTFPQPSGSSGQQPPGPGDLSGGGASLFPEIDAFLTREVLRGAGRVRRWSYLPRRELLTFDLSGHRFCHRVGRPHRSNNVIYVVDLRRKVFYQKCQDPDCRAVNFKSEEWPLPDDVLPWHGMLEEEALEDNCGTIDEDDQFLVDSLEETEFELEAAKLVEKFE